MQFIQAGILAMHKIMQINIIMHFGLINYFLEIKQKTLVRQQCYYKGKLIRNLKVPFGALPFGALPFAPNTSGSGAQLLGEC